MNIKEVNFYDANSKTLTLVTGIKDHEKQEVETKTHHYPFFVKGMYIKKAIDLGYELEEANYVIRGDMFDRLSNFIVEIYNKQFTTEDLVDGIDQRSIISVFYSILFGVLQGDQKNE